MQLSVLNYLEESAGKYPDKIALQDTKESYTYRQYQETARIIGSRLTKMTPPKQAVVIYMQKSVRSIISFLGVVYAGCYYTPLDNQMPMDRVKLIIKQIEPAAIIYDSTTEDYIRELGLTEISIRYDEITSGTILEDRLLQVRKQQRQTDILYTLFTSGSTGVPKGVTISNLAVIDLTEWACSVFPLDETIRVCNQAPLHFDVSVFDIYGCLKAGGTLFVPPKTYYTFPVRVLQYIEDNQINLINWAPAALTNAVDCNAFDVVVPKSLKLIIFAGEVLPCKYLNEWRRHVPDATYVNAYGPTEATCFCMYYVVDREFTDDGVIPLGIACENSEIVLLDENNQAAKDGEMGEICVIGQCLSQGYVKAAELTEKSFVQNPLNTKWSERMYKTGDLAYVNEEGDMIFCGRKDSQIKRLGYRIELGEIEHAILSIPEVTTACCLFDQNKKDILALYTGEIAEDKVQEILFGKVPNYMQPGQMIRLEEMPRNLNNKIDRTLLSKKYIG